MLHQQVVATAPVGYHRSAGDQTLNADNQVESDKLTSTRRSNYRNNNSNNNNPTGRFLTFNHWTTSTNYEQESERSYTDHRTTTTAAKVKRLELLVRRLVKSSAELLTASSGKNRADIEMTKALSKAREALTCLESLRVIVTKVEHQRNQQQVVDDGEDGNRVPITTNVHLFELTVMVRSHLANCLVQTEKFDEAVEIYTQLCKLAPNTNVDNLSNESQRPPNSTNRYLLHRFGLNIGNIHFKQRNLTKALKYYRLTLDRMASIHGHQQLKVKLMANISLCLIELSNSANQSVSSDSINSFNLLLNDNVCQTDQQEGSANKLQQVTINANHHKFGLNLMCCHYLRSDLRSMLATLRALVKVDLCDHYQEVAATHAPTAPNHALGASAGSERLVIGENSTLSEQSGDSLELVVSERKREVSRCIVASCNLMLDLDQHITRGDLRSTSTSARDLCRELLKSSEKYKSLSGDLEANMLSALLRSGNKLNEAIRSMEETSASTLIANTATSGGGSSQSLPVGGSICQFESTLSSSSLSTATAKFKSSERDVTQQQPQQQVSDHKLTGGESGNPNKYLNMTTASTTSMIQSTLSATNLCLYKLLKGDHELAIDLGHLAVGIDMRNQFAWVNLANCHLLRALAASRGRLPISSTKKSTGQTTNTTTTTNSNVIHDLNLAESCYMRALLLDATCWQANYNLALVNRLQLLYVGSERGIERSLLPTMTASKSDGHSFKQRDGNDQLSLQQVGSIVKRQSQQQQLAETLVASDTGNLRLLAYQRLFLAPLQFALFLLRSSTLTTEKTSGNNQQQAEAILNELIQSAKQAPEVHLLASRVGGSAATNGEFVESTATDNMAKKQTINRLKLANRDYPYHLPVTERLIALLIDSFNYQEASQLLLTCCLHLRPDQLRWYQLLAECHRRAAEYKEAILIYKAAIGLFPRESLGCIKSLSRLADELGIVELQSWIREKESKVYKMLANRG